MKRDDGLGRDHGRAHPRRKMFGGLAFLVRGNFAVSAHKDGGLMIRCSSQDWDAFCAEDRPRPMLSKGKPRQRGSGNRDVKMP